MVVNNEGPCLYAGNADKSNPKDAFGSRKPLLHLVPPALVLWVSEVFKQSAIKYGPYNWRSTNIRLSVYIDAAMRHLLALQDGQIFDPETGLPHWAHIGANAAIGLDSFEQGTLVNDLVWKTGNATDLIFKLTDKTP